jgi:hypothetical protein
MHKALIWKVYRLWRLVENKHLRKMKFTDAELILQIFSVVLADLAIHVVRLLTSAPFSVTNQKQLAGTPFTYVVTSCTSTGDKWMTASAALKVLVLIVALGLTLKVSKLMDNDKLGDAKPLMFAAYNFSIFGVVYALMSSNIEGSAGVAAAYILIAAAATISVAFIAVPKYIVIFTQGDVSEEAIKVSMKSKATDNNNTSQGSAVTTNNSTNNTDNDIVSKCSSRCLCAFSIAPLPFSYILKYQY